MLTEQQKKQRKKGIGGSDVAGILGCSSYGITPLKIYNSKIDFGFDKNDEDNEILRRGNVLEPFVKALFAMKANINDITQDDKTYYHKDYNFIIGNIDAFIPSQNAIVEIKTCDFNRYYSKKEFGEEYTDQIPTDYMLQVQHYLMVTQKDLAYVPVLINKNERFRELVSMIQAVGVAKTIEICGLTEIENLKIYTVKSSLELQDFLIKKEKFFWNEYVLKRTPPPPAKTTEDLMLAFPRHYKDKFCVANSKQISLIDEIKETNEKIKNLEKIKEEKELELKLEIQDNEGIKDEFGAKLVTYKTVETTKIDLKEIEKTKPSLYEIIKKRFSKTNTTRRFHLYK